MEENEDISMIDWLVAMTIREVVCEYIDKKTGLGIMNVRNKFMQLMKDERDTPENIRVWFERNIR